jgi:hypothetical protein
MLKLPSIAFVAVTLLGAALPGPALAQTSPKGENGGDVVVMENHPIEFVSKGQEIIFYILDEDRKTPVPTKSASARAVIQDAGKTTAINLEPDEPNKFVGRLALPLGAKARVVFSAKVAGHNLQARFVNN